MKRYLAPREKKTLDYRHSMRGERWRFYDGWKGDPTDNLSRLGMQRHSDYKRCFSIAEAMSLYEQEIKEERLNSISKRINVVYVNPMFNKIKSL